MKFKDIAEIIFEIMWRDNHNGGIKHIASAEEILEESNLKDDLDIDSLQKEDLALALEDAFDIYFPSEDIQPMTTAGEVFMYVSQRLPTEIPALPT